MDNAHQFRFCWGFSRACGGAREQRGSEWFSELAVHGGVDIVGSLCTVSRLHVRRRSSSYSMFGAA
jgi:hypothetical protein